MVWIAMSSQCGFARLTATWSLDQIQSPWTRPALLFAGHPTILLTFLRGGAQPGVIHNGLGAMRPEAWRGRD